MDTQNLWMAHGHSCSSPVGESFHLQSLKSLLFEYCGTEEAITSFPVREGFLRGRGQRVLPKEIERNFDVLVGVSSEARLG